ncbi:alpha/beta fold hydrolase [Fulvivirga sedimenti]|uniref:Alpha/beta hydrolase n=1 Tax=Fulvivirga sedimenti TaxID=2879465 RepID=A0A9X1HV00_9BACT|nr:alpha/beta fold hydrolase [Fulvivirga sedimenti]MCA6078405.1 alpha/beta hydrolase [Fulvivirga sedimenti]
MNREALILLHGALGSSAQVEPLIPYLKQDFDVYTLNFSGHGGLPVPSRFSINDFTSDVVRFMDLNKLPYAHIFGFSMGGYVALKLAERTSKRTGKIMTLGTKFDWTPETADKEKAMLNPSKIEEKVPAFARFLLERHAPSDWKQVLHTTAGMMTALGNQPDWIAGRNTVMNEVCLMVGSLDSMVTIDETRKIADALENGSFRVLEGVLHPMEKADPSSIAGEILSFIK